MGGYKGVTNIGWGVISKRWEGPTKILTNDSKVKKGGLIRLRGEKNVNWGSPA